MLDIEREGEPAVADIGVDDGKRAGGEPSGDRKAKLPKAQEIVVAVEDEIAVLDPDPELLADAAADMLLEPGRSGEQLCGMYDLRHAFPACIEACPSVSAGRGGFGDGNDTGGAGIQRRREGAADRPRELHKQSSRPAHRDLGDASGIDCGVARRDTLGKARARGGRKCEPFVVAQQRPETPITGTRRTRFHASSSLIEFDTLERAMPSVSAISSAARGRSER